MSVAEMKIAAINEITKLNDEKALKEILVHLVSLSGPKNKDAYNLSRHYDEFVSRYGKVLEKLAQ